jgi:hypothetical protein
LAPEQPDLDWERPQQDAKTTCWAACLLGVQGRLNEALAELRRALERRPWWSTAKHERAWRED